MATMPIYAALILAAWFCYGCFPTMVVMALGAYKWACHGLGSMSTGPTLVLAICPVEGYFLK